MDKLLSQAWKEQLRQVGLRATGARLAILSLLAAETKPLEVQIILKRLGKQAPDQATIYRILRSLKKAGLVKEVMLRAGFHSYEISSLPHHHHLVCAKCGFVEDVTACCDEPEPVNTSFRTVTSHNLEFSGICKNCPA